MILKQRLGVTQGHRNRHVSIRHLWLPINVPWQLCMGLSCTVWEIDGDFSQKSQIFPTPCILRPSRRGSPWNWVSALGVKKLESWGYWPRKMFDNIFSRLDTMHERDGQTDGRTDGRQQRPH